MRQLVPAIMVLVIGWSVSLRSQAAAAGIVGTVTDATGALVPQATVTVVNREKGIARTIRTVADGMYSAGGLLPAEYVLRVEVAGFKRIERTVTLETGTTTKVDLVLEIGDLHETVVARDERPLIRHDHHQVGGVVRREQIESLPLNGRNYMDLAKLEPGVGNVVRAAGNRMFVPVFGAGLMTIPRVGSARATIDGANIGSVGTAGTVLQVSQDAVQEFHISTANFDVIGNLTIVGTVNIVTRSGGNTSHGSGFWLYRDHHLAAYPALNRDRTNPDPFFRRQQFGGSVGGPLRKNRAFSFFSYEHSAQRGVGTVQPRTPDFAHLGGIFPTRARDNLASVRVDMQLTSAHGVFARYTHDDTRGFGPIASPIPLPSAWPRARSRADQGLIALTSAFSSALVNDIRVSHLSGDAEQAASDQSDCPGCFGVGMQHITIPDAGIGFGKSREFTFQFDRYQVSNTLTWQRGRHRLRVGFDWEHETTTSSTTELDPITLWSPAQIRRQDPGIPLPPSFMHVSDILRLSVRNVEISEGPVLTLQRGFRPERILDMFRASAGEVWNIGSRLTVNGGLAWAYEPNALNHDLTKPAWLVPLVGEGGLAAPRPQRRNFSPTLGFVWVATRDTKTVVRGGLGRYFEPDSGNNINNLLNERQALLPLGTGRLTRTGSSISFDGGTLERRQPTFFTAAQLLEILPGIRSELLKSLNPANRDFTFRNIDATKQGTNLKDRVYRTPSAVHVALGVQREFNHGVAISLDAVWKRYMHIFINGIDYNRWGNITGPVIPPCTSAQSNDLTAACSRGSIFFDTTIGRARYRGLVLRVDKRFSRGTQFLGSYALGSFVGTNGTGTATGESAGGRVFGFNNDDWFENYGPLPSDRRHLLNVSGMFELPWQFRVAYNVTAYSASPFSVYVEGVDFNGDGTSNDLLPGTTVNGFRRRFGRSDLEQLVDDYNDTWAGRPTPNGLTAPRLVLPEGYDFDDSFFTQDLRITRAIPVPNVRGQLLVFAEVFNVLNTANLVGYSGNLASQSFGRPGARFTQVFGSGGPRAFQLGARLTF